ncbi:MAG: zinc-ribbon domain-containing protein [Eggerthellaceae bacterium]|nr:zinc-ribbon domain-containing protein [Eggerthellaceae bacterium]
MICASCGTEIPDDSILCPNCGSDPIATVSAVVEEPAPAKSASNQAPINYSKLSKAQYKDAKAAYKAARKAAGKSRAPLVVLCIILALALAAGGAVAAWFYFNPKVENLTNENKELQTQVEKLTTENKELSQKIAEYEKDGNNVTPSNPDTTNPLIGAWKVDSFDNTTMNPACYGGKAKQASVRVNIKEIDATKGTIIADLSVVYHGHERNKQKGDMDSSTDDVVLEYTNVEGTYADDAFTFELPVDSKYGNNSGIVVSGLMTTSDATSVLGNSTSSSFQLSVKSYYQSLTNAITDTYIMKN